MASSCWQIVGRAATLRTACLTATVDPDNPAVGLRVESLCGHTVAGAALFGVQIAQSVLAAATPQATLPVDCFARGNDLVATYAETADRPFRAQIYWRLIDNETGSEPSCGERFGGGHQAESFVALELIVSVQTSQFDSDTSLAVCTTLAGVESWRMLDAAEDRLAPDGDPSAKDLARGRSPDSDPVVPEFHASESPGCCLLRPIGSGPSYIEMVHPADFRQTTFEWTTDSSPVVRLSHRLFAERLEKGVILRSRIRGLFIVRSHDTETARTEYRRFAASEPPLTA
jgi:hypothetical protein